MIATKSDLFKKKLLICRICNKPIEVNQSYEKIVTKRRSEIILHSECIKNESM